MFFAYDNNRKSREGRDFMAAEERDKQRCCMCRSILEEKNARRLPEKLGGGYVPYCANCQEKVYKYLSAVLGYRVAMFFCAAMMNAPYLPELFEQAKTYTASLGAWGGYLAALRHEGRDSKEGKQTGFRDGITDLRKAFGGDYETLHLSDEMLSDEDYISGHRAQAETWGYGPEKQPYTQEDYDRLDEIFEAIASNRANLGDQARLAIQKIAKWTLEQDRCFNKGDFEGAKRLQDIIKIEMENEQLRKKDSLPTDTVRIDDIVMAIERAGLHIMDYDELCTELANHSFHRTYPYTRDAADQMLLLIRNATAWNEGRAEVASLPPEFRITDELGEFAQEQDETEKEIYGELQLSPMN